LKESKPKVLILGKLPPPYMGPAIATQIILNSSLNNDWDLHHFNTQLNKDISKMGKWSFKKSALMLKKYNDFKKTLKNVQPNLVLIPISQTTMGFVKDAPYIRLAKKSGAKVLIQLRGSDFKNWLNRSSKKINDFVRNTLAYADGVIVLGENLKYLFKDYFPENKIFVVPNGGNFTFPTVNIEENSPKEILYFANFLRNKGFIYVLKAVAELNKDKSLPPFKLLASGSWDDKVYKNECLQFIEQNKLNNVEITNKKSGASKWEMFAKADIFTFCPIAPEGHPWVIVEAMAAGLPIISTNQGAIIESVFDGDNGFIVETGNFKDIAEKIRLLLKDEKLRLKMGEASKNRYNQYFTEEKMVQNLNKVFNEIMQK
jgi:glycosyltransferase involved in cell wall biosynthesis